MNSHSFRPRSRTDRALAWSALAVLATLTSPVVADPIYNLTPLVTDDQDALADEGFGPAARSIRT